MTNLELILAGAELLSKANDNLDDSVRIWLDYKQVHIIREAYFRELAGDREITLSEFNPQGTNDKYDELSFTVGGWKFFTLIYKLEHNEA